MDMETKMTLEEITQIIRAENPTLRRGNDEEGYTDLTIAEYEIAIAERAIGRLEKINKVMAIKDKIDSKIAAFDKLTALGLEPSAFDLDKEDLLFQSKKVVKDLEALGL